MDIKLLNLDFINLKHWLRELYSVWGCCWFLICVNHYIVGIFRRNEIQSRHEIAGQSKLDEFRKWLVEIAVHNLRDIPFGLSETFGELDRKSVV